MLCGLQDTQTSFDGVVVVNDKTILIILSNITGINKSTNGMI